MTKAFCIAVVVSGGLMAGATVRADAPALDSILSGVTNVVSVLDRYKLPIDATQAQRAVVESIIKVADPSARIMTRAAYDHMVQESTGNDYATGVRISMTNGQPRVIDVQAGSPAAEAGLQAGDTITKINDEAIDHSDIATCCGLLRGHTGGTVRVQYTRALNPTNQAVLALKMTILNAIESAEQLPDQLAYLKLNGLYPGSGKEIVSVLRGWAETGRFGVVIDLRGANGNDLDSVTEIASLLAASGEKLYAFKSPDGKEISSANASVGSLLNMPVMVLTDHGTAGAPEVLAAVLADSVRGAMVVGQETCGDPMIREAVDLPSGDVLYLATRVLATDASTTYNGRSGIKPDIAVRPPEKAPADYEPELISSERRILLDQEVTDRALRDRLRGDEAFKRSVDVLLGLKALNLRGPANSTDKAN